MNRLFIFLLILIALGSHAQTITIYGTNSCGYTTDLKNQLTKAKIPFTYCNIETTQCWNELVKVVNDFNLSKDGYVDLPVVKVESYNKTYAYVRPSLETLMKFTPIGIVGSRILIYPNPVENTLYILGTNKLIRIYDIEGNLMLMTRDREVDISYFPTGGYIIKIESISLTFIKK